MGHADSLFSSEFSALGCAEATGPNEIVLNYLKASQSTDAKINRCAVLNALKFTDLVRLAFASDDYKAYASLMDILNRQLVEARQFDLRNGLCPKNKNDFCQSEKIIYDLAISVQQLWSTYYVELLTAEEFEDQLRKAGSFAAGAGVAALIFVVRFPKQAKEMNRVFQRLGKRLFARLGASGRAAVSSRVALAAGAGASGVTNLKERPSVAETPSKRLFDAPMTFLDAPGEDSLAREAGEWIDLIADVSRYTLETSAVFLASTYVSESFLTAMIAQTRGIKWLSGLMAIGKKPTVLSVGILAGAWLGQVQAEGSLRARHEDLDRRLRDLRRKIVSEAGSTKAFATYLLVSEYAQLISEKATLESLPFTVEVQDQEHYLFRVGHCLPYNMPAGKEDSQSRRAQLELSFRGAQAKLDRTRAQYQKEIARAHAVLNDGILFLEKFARPEWSEVIGGLKQNRILLWTYERSKKMPEYWMLEAEAQARNSAGIAVDLDLIWAEFEATGQLSPETWGLYQNALYYVGEYSMFENSLGQPGFNCNGVGDYPAILWRDSILR